MYKEAAAVDQAHRNITPEAGVLDGVGWIITSSAAVVGSVQTQWRPLKQRQTTP
jgi:hypothetical protein